MKVEKWIYDGKEVEIPIVSDEEIEKNDISNLEKLPKMENENVLEKSEESN